MADDEPSREQQVAAALDLVTACIAEDYDAGDRLIAEVGYERRAGAWRTNSRGRRAAGCSPA